tara:strand:+ start:9655 stop:10200 length:546 start_codon:yes stop_codon:yes gene_type:complete
MTINYSKTRVLNLLGCIIAMGLFTSYVPFVERSSDNTIDNNFFLQISGNYNKVIKGEMCFESSYETTNRGVTFSTLRLELEDTKNNKFSLLISKENSLEPISLGTYRITNERTGSMNYFDGAFGYLNVLASDELPFYTENGKIVITKINGKVIEGFIKLSLENFNQKKINISGNFIASNLN